MTPPALLDRASVPSSELTGAERPLPASPHEMSYIIRAVLYYLITNALHAEFVFASL